MTLEKLLKLKPDAVIAYVRGVIREKLGDEAENATVMFAEHGYYFLTIVDSDTYVLRRKHIPAFLKNLSNL